MQRGLAAQPTEGLSLYSFSLFYDPVDIFAHSVEIFTDFLIGYPYHRQPVRFKKSSSFFIVDFAGIRIMSGTVYLNDEFRLGAIKVNDIFSENFLSGKSDKRIFT